MKISDISGQPIDHRAMRRIVYQILRVYKDEMRTDGRPQYTAAVKRWRRKVYRLTNAPGRFNASRA